MSCISRCSKGITESGKYTFFGQYLDSTTFQRPQVKAIHGCLRRSCPQNAAYSLVIRLTATSLTSATSAAALTVVLNSQEPEPLLKTEFLTLTPTGHQLLLIQKWNERAFETQTVGNLVGSDFWQLWKRKASISHYLQPFPTWPGTMSSRGWLHQQATTHSRPAPDRIFSSKSSNFYLLLSTYGWLCIYDERDCHVF